MKGPEAVADSVTKELREAAQQRNQHAHCYQHHPDAHEDARSNAARLPPRLVDPAWWPESSWVIRIARVDWRRPWQAQPGRPLASGATTTGVRMIAQFRHVALSLPDRAAVPARKCATMLVMAASSSRPHAQLTERARRKPCRCTGSGEAGLRGFSQRSGAIADSPPLRENPSVDTLHLANRIVFGRSKLTRSLG